MILIGAGVSDNFSDNFRLLPSFVTRTNFSVTTVTHDEEIPDQHDTSKMCSTVLLGIVTGSVVVIMISGTFIGALFIYKGEKWYYGLFVQLAV